MKIDLIQFKLIELKLEEVWKRFEEAGFKPLLIKGWAAAQMYPNPSERKFTDLDIVISPEKYLEALEFVENSEFAAEIDLHKGIGRLDSLSFDDLYADSIAVKCGAINIRIPRPEDHLRILCVHWLNDGGAKKEKLQDIFYAVANRPDDFDWNRCLNVVSRRRRRWVICAIGLAHKYLDLKIDDLSFAAEAANVPEWMSETVEKEWRSRVGLGSLALCLNDRKAFFTQIRKRFPPNPIQATIEMEGELDERTRIYYQASNILWRLPPSIRRISQTLFNKIKIKYGRKNNAGF